MPKGKNNRNNGDFLLLDIQKHMMFGVLKLRGAAHGVRLLSLSLIMVFLLPFWPESLLTLIVSLLGVEVEMQ